MTVEVELPESFVPDEPATRKTPTRRRPRRWWVWTVRVVLCLIAIVVLTPLALGARVWYQARQDERPSSDAIIVLGAAQYNGTPSPTLQARLQHALDLYREKVAPAIVTVGSKQPGDRFTEAAAGRNWLIEKGKVPSDKVVSVPEGKDTLQSMEAIGRVYKKLGWHSGVIVTDPWHSLRSKTMAGDNGITAAASPTHSGPSVQTRDTQFHYIVRETGGLLWYGTFGRIYGEQ
ncbi:MAG: hypothetical protein JWN52_7814 [Actinomycetia bacterium]|nr:hypothetical protein [Actinomycetes bacterium]